MAQQNDHRWNEQLALLIQYVELYGKFPSAQTEYKECALGQWLANQISAYNRGALKENRVTQLNAFSPAWNASPMQRKAAAKKILLESNWKRHLKPSDIPIDAVFSGDDLFLCLSHQLYTCEDYLIHIMELIGNNLGCPNQEVPKSKLIPNLTSFDCRRKVFSVQFPGIDFGCFNLRCAAFGFPEKNLESPANSYLCSAKFFQKETPYQNAEHMREVYSTAIDTLSPKTIEVILAKYFIGLSVEEIAKKQCISIPRVKQIERTSLEKFRSPAIQEILAVGKLQKKITPDADIRELGLSLRSFNALKRANINTVRHLVRMTKNDLLHLRNMGQHSVEEIEAILNTYSISEENSPNNLSQLIF